MNFPNDFIFGAATASYQIEGAVNEGGRSPSIWDRFSHTPGKVLNGDTGDRACDHYHRIEEDVKLMADLGMKAYRFSIAWPRMQKDGRGEVNRDGVAFYNRLIDCLLEHGITPWATLYHWDLPDALQEEFGGWTSPKVVPLFKDYARICFENFGDRVKNWITLNEPWCSSVLGYGLGTHAPGIVDRDAPYLAAHHLLLAHGQAVGVYRHEFSEQGGVIGITNNCDFRYALTESVEDKAAAERSMQFFLAWFADPVFSEENDYSAAMRERLGDRLPTFSAEEKALLKGSSDFFGLNHYTSMFASEEVKGEEIELSATGNGGMAEDQGVTLTVDPSWESTHMDWAIVPDGCRRMLHWISDRYGEVPIYITENGCACDEEDHETAINDEQRRAFFEGYLGACAQAVEEGVNLQGYFAWSLLDNFEWSFGYSRRFGIVRVDFETLERTPKSSALWYRDLIKG